MKKLELTPKITTLLMARAEGVDVNAVSVYESISLNTLPVNKGGVWQGAVATESALREMAAFVVGGGNVPIHQLHDQAYALPVGKTIHAEVFTEGGLPEVRSLFYVDNTHTKIISGLETSSIDEVSVGFQPKHMMCSECGWDYKGESATMENFWERTCENGHTIGENGVHLNLSGMEHWYETSLVSRGAANGAKILGRSKSLMGEKEYNRLAASGISPDVRILFASPTIVTPENPMDLEKLTAQFTAQLGTQAAAVATAQAQVTAQAAQIATLTADLATANTAKATAEAAKVASDAALAAVNSTDSAKALTLAQTAATEARTALFSHATKLAVAAGGAKPADTATVAELTASMADSASKLAALPIGGVALDTQHGSGKKIVASYAASNFETR